ncbi:hypothetical protein CF166_20495 [Amycolatopsis sp. KNN50.9b]|nr:hypothetical protein CF166_20495 [Amycolatopsis sp. KNN50.9b]
MGRSDSTSELALTEAERQALTRWIGLPSTSQAVVLRCKIVLACEEGRTNVDIAREFGVSAQVVGKWRARFREGRLPALKDRPRSGAPRTIAEEQVQAVVDATFTEPPPNGVAGPSATWPSGSGSRPRRWCASGSGSVSLPTPAASARSSAPTMRRGARCTSRPRRRSWFWPRTRTEGPRPTRAPNRQRRPGEWRCAAAWPDCCRSGSEHRTRANWSGSCGPCSIGFPSGRKST